MPEHDHRTATIADDPAFIDAKTAQAAAADPNRSAWVEANAGSGKTKVLIDRVARLLLPRPDGQPGARPDSIVCLTYTRAAANEMLSRLFTRLGAWTVSDDETLRQTLSALEQSDPETYSPQALREARCLFARALETPGGIRIETIHAFCTRVLRRFPLEAALSPGFTTMEEAEADTLWRDVLRTHLASAMPDFRDEIAILAEATGGNGVMAALNALKPERLNLHAFANRLPKGQNTDTSRSLAEPICAALNTHKSTKEDIYAHAMGTDLPAATIERIRAVLAGTTKRGVSDKKLLGGLEAVLSNDTPAQRYKAYMDAIAGTKHDFSEKSNPYTKAVTQDNPDIVALYARDMRTGGDEGREITRMKAVKDALAAQQTADRTIALLKLGLPVLKAYQDAKTERAVLDFDDLVACTYRLLRQSSAAEWVLYKLDGGLSHILLDEAQDTSPAQWQLINALVAEMRAGAGRDRGDEPRTQFTVGDPKQSIYSFHGADAAVFKQERLNFEEAEHARAKTQNRAVNMPEMLMSFRSSPEILTFVDAVLAHWQPDGAVTDTPLPVEADIKTHQPYRRHQPGRVELWPLEMPVEQNEPDSHWRAPVDYMPPDAPRRRLADRIASCIRTMIDQGETVWKEDKDRSWQRTPISPQDILILVQQRNNLFEALINSLKQQGLPVAGADKLHLLDTLGVQDCLNLLRFALQPDDDLTLAEILRGPFCGLIDDDNHLFVLAHGRPKTDSLWHRLQACHDPLFSPAKSFCQSLFDKRHLPAFDFLNAVLTHRGTDGLNGLDRLVQRLGEPVREPVSALLADTLGHDMTEPASLQNYLHTIESQEIVLKRELSTPDAAIRVMTVHGAKGLQAPVVILPDTVGNVRLDKIGPLFFTQDGTPLYSPSSKHDCTIVADRRKRAEADAKSESHRLLYVAMTRASDRLIIAGAGTKKSKIGYGKTAWYRDCLVAMNALTKHDTDEKEAPPVPEQIRTLGPEPVVQTQSAQTRDGTSPPAVPDWLTRPVPLSSPTTQPVAPSRLGRTGGLANTPSQAGQVDAMRRGQIIHDLLRILPDTEPAMRERTAKTVLATITTLAKEQVREIYDTTLKTLTHPDFKAIFAPGGRSEVPIVGTLPDGQMVNGRIDRLIITKAQILIVDYKTDRPAPDRAEQISVSNLAQMAAYRAVIAALYDGKRPVDCAFLYTDGPVLLKPTPEQMSKALTCLHNPV